jgi:predicted nucleotidyltransferase
VNNIIRFWISGLRDSVCGGVFFLEALELVKYKGAKRVFETLSRFPKRRFTISELAKTSKTPFSSVWRLVKKWEKAGIVEAGRIGKSVAVNLKQSAYTSKVSELVRLSESPQAFTVKTLKRTLKKTRGVKKVFLFGSTARGEEELDSDVDLAVLARKNFDADALVFGVCGELGTKVIPIVFRDEKQLEEFLRGKDKVKIV